MISNSSKYLQLPWAPSATLRSLDRSLLLMDSLLILCVGNEETFYKHKVFRQLGAPLRMDISNKQIFEWIWMKVQKKLKRWEFVLVSFHNRAKIINSYIILLVSFDYPLLKMAKVHWKEFLKSIKRFLWQKQF